MVLSARLIAFVHLVFDAFRWGTDQLDLFVDVVTHLDIKTFKVALNEHIPSEDRLCFAMLIFCQLTGGPLQLLAGHVQDRIGLVWILLQRLDSFGCRQDGQSDFAAMRFTLHLFHDRQGPRARADHQSSALPRYILLD
jgi:hypothetical protein